LAASILSVLSFPPFGLWPCCLAAVAMLLVLLRDRSTLTATRIGFLYGLAYGLGTMHWFFSLFSVLAIPLIAIFAAYFALLAYLIALTRNQTPLVRALLAGLFAAGMEWQRGDAWYLRFPWYSVPHALAQEPRCIAPVRWLGTYGFSFSIWTVAALGAFSRFGYWAAFVLIPISSLILPSFAPPDRRALLVQAEQTPSLERVIMEIPEGKVDLAVLPEYAYGVEAAVALKSQSGPAAVALKCGCPVVFGAVQGAHERGDFENVAVIVDADGRVQGTFTKQRPVPLFRDGRPGRSRPVFRVDGRVLGVAICYDFDAPAIAGTLVEKGAQILVAPTLDPMSWGKMQHSHHELLLRLRAVENARWILRAASSGRSEAVNPHGEPSEQGVPVSQTGCVTVAFADVDEVPWGAHGYLLGPMAATGTLLFAAICVARSMRARWIRNPGPSSPGNGHIQGSVEENNAHGDHGRLCCHSITAPNGRPFCVSGFAPC
jgi:apolipoprotein N-acyltransferase